MSTAKIIDFYNAKQGVNMENLKKGYIAITRSVRKAEWAKCAIKRTLWENILIDACYKNRTVNFKGIEWDLLRGQLVTTREILASQIEINGKPVTPLTIRRALEFFEKKGMISKNGNRLGTVITIVNYDIYQSYFFDQSNDQRNDQPKDQSEASNSKGSHNDNDQRHDQSNDQRNDQQNNKVLEQESNNKYMSSGDDGKTPKLKKIKPDYQAVLEAYQDVVLDGLPIPDKINQKRKALINKLFKEIKNPSVETVRKYFIGLMDQVKDKPFYFGGPNHDGWKLNFDYVLHVDTLTKTREGAL